MSYLTQAYGAVKLFTTANAPTIMVGSGVISMTVGAVLGAKKTLHLEETLGEHVAVLEAIHETRHNPAMPDYDDQKATSDRIKVYTRVGVSCVKLYAVPAVFFLGGTALVFGGHHIMLQRNATLAMAFTGLKKSFDAYRGRVVNQYGTEADQAFLGGYELKEVIDPESGDVRTIAVRDWESADQDPYNRVFSRENSTQWENDLGVNKMFIQNQLKFAQIKLGLQGHLYLADVYEALGFPETDISRVVGWKVTRLPDGTKNVPHIDFGLNSPHPDDWKYNRENAIYLDFNCQGLIIGGKVQKALEAST